MALSQEPEIIYLLSLVTAKVAIEEVCPFNLPTFFSKRLHIIIVLSYSQQEIIYLLSLATETVKT